MEMSHLVTACTHIHTPVVAVPVLLASSPLAVFALCPVGHAAQLVCLRVGRERDAVEHRLAGDGGAPAIGRGERGHEVEQRCGRHDCGLLSRDGLWSVPHPKENHRGSRTCGQAKTSTR